MENSFNKDKSVDLKEILDTKKIMIYALCEKLWQHDFTIVIEVKLLINGLCWEKFNENVNFSKSNILENSFNKDKSVGL